MELKTCSKCHLEKPLEFFVKRKHISSGHGSRCKLCISIAHRNYRNTHPEVNLRARGAVRRFNLRQNFGMSDADYASLLAKQAGVCAICKQLETRTSNGQLYRLCVDHNHDTGTVRELLCATCNSALGFLKDDAILAEALLNYMKKWAGK